MEYIYDLDFGILGFIRDHLSCPAGDVIMKIFTYSGSGGAVWVAIALVMLIAGRRKWKMTGAMLAAALVTSLIIDNIMLKNLIARPRPFIADPGFVPAIPPPMGYSFPSGHSCSSFACAAVLHRRLGKGVSGKWAVFAVSAAWLTAAVIAFSRLYFFVHFPTDVMAGAVIGVVIGLAAVRATEVIHKHYKNERT